MGSDMAFDPKQFTDDDDFQSFIQEQVGNAISGFERKNAQLLDELKKAKEKARSAPDADELESLREQAEKAAEYERKQLEHKGEYETLISKTKEQHKAEVEKLKGQLEKATASMRKLLVEGGLSTALAEANCNPTLLKAAVKLLSDDISVVEEGDVMVARVGAQTIQEYIQEWSSSEVGKNFVRAPASRGGNAGANGANGSAGTASEHEAYFIPGSPGYSLTKQVELRNTDPAAYEALKRKYPELAPQPMFGRGIR